MKTATGVVLLLATLVAGCSDKIDQTKFDALNRAARAVRESTAIGVNLLKFREIVSTYATEVSLATDKASSPNEREFLRFHTEALEAYRASLETWGQKIRGELAETSADDQIHILWGRANAKLLGADALYLNKPLTGDVPGLPTP